MVICHSTDNDQNVVSCWPNSALSLLSSFFQRASVSAKGPFPSLCELHIPISVLFKNQSDEWNLNPLNATKTKQPSVNASWKWMVQGVEASQHRTEKSSQMALVRGYCLLEGPPRLVAPFGQLWKRCSFPLASLMTDFLEAVLREMACSVPDSRLCQSSSPHTNHLPTQNTQISTVFAGNCSGCRYDRLYGSPAVPRTIPNSTLVHPSSSSLQCSETKF